jgi:hypothetical protein
VIAAVPVACYPHYAAAYRPWGREKPVPVLGCLRNGEGWILALRKRHGNEPLAAQVR